jgi:hypothetical protein
LERAPWNLGEGHHIKQENFLWSKFVRRDIRFTARLVRTSRPILTRISVPLLKRDAMAGELPGSEGRGLPHILRAVTCGSPLLPCSRNCDKSPNRKSVDYNPVVATTGTTWLQPLNPYLSQLALSRCYVRPGPSLLDPAGAASHIPRSWKAAGSYQTILLGNALVEYSMYAGSSTAAAPLF